MSFKTLDVAIGVVFLYLLLTLVASVLVEFLSTLRNWRGRMLRDALGDMLEGNSTVDAATLYASPFIRTLGRNSDSPKGVNNRKGVFAWNEREIEHQNVLPSYIPSSAFSTAVIFELVIKAPENWLEKSEESSHHGGNSREGQISPDSTVALLNMYLERDKCTDALFAVVVAALATQGPSVQAVRLAIERWYNECMDRVSGWYKRRAQRWLFGIGLVVAFAANINTIAVSTWLWTGDAARQAVVAAAADVAKANAPKGADGKVDYSELPKQVVTAETFAVAMEYPLGWGKDLSGNPLSYLFGCLITAIAISMGSSFWFDALQTLVKIRGTGPKPVSR